MKKLVGIGLMFTVLLLLTMAEHSSAQPALQPSSVPGIMVQQGFDAEIFASGLNLPVQLALESDGSVLVMVASNCGYCPVVRLSQSGDVLAESNSISDPDGVAVDSLGQVYVAGGSNITIAGSLDGGTDEIFATYFWNLNNIAIDSTDRIVVVQNNGDIYEVTAAGIKVEPPLASLGVNGNALAFDKTDRLFAGRYDLQGGPGELYLIDVPGSPTLISSEVNPMAIAVGQGDIFGSEIYVAEYFEGTVKKVDEGNGAATEFASGLDKPHGLVFDSTDGLLVSEMELDRIIRIFPVDAEGPVASDVVAVPNPTPVDGMLTVTAFVSDIDTGNSNIDSAEYSLDGGIVWYPMAASDFSFDEPSEDVTETFSAPSTAGVYDLCVRATDDVGNTGPEECTFLVAYDPDGGFVTGGGWIDSPEGAYADDPALTGKANFGFVSKYQEGASAPTGETQFQFKVADLNFHSDSYEWLVVTGSNYAMYKGSGTINGEGDYRFRIWAGDDDPDTFRIRIWEEDESGVETDVYDNGFDQAIGGGSIVIHQAN